MKQEPFIESAHLLFSPLIMCVMGIVFACILLRITNQITLLSLANSCFTVSCTIDRLGRERYINIEPSIINLLLKIGLISFIVLLHSKWDPSIDGITIIIAFFIEKYFRKASNYGFFSHFIPNAFDDIRPCMNKLKL